VIRNLPLAITVLTGGGVVKSAHFTAFYRREPPPRPAFTANPNLARARCKGQ
jgi:hypothetical protein